MLGVVPGKATKTAGGQLMKDKARAFAVNAHGSQQYGERPYVYHLDAVASLLNPFGETAVVLGYLHDVVEDTPVTLEQVQAEFGELVASCVALLTDETGVNRRERKARTYAKLAEVSGVLEIALTVKVADRLANVKACVADGKTGLLNMYRSEHGAFRRAAFRVGNCDTLWFELDSLLDGRCQ